MPEARPVRSVRLLTPASRSGFRVVPENAMEAISACTRAYGDSSPSDIRFAPFALNGNDVRPVRRQRDGEDIGTL